MPPPQTGGIRMHPALQKFEWRPFPLNPYLRGKVLFNEMGPNDFIIPA